MRRKRSLQTDDDAAAADLPMRRFKRPHSGNLSLRSDSTKFNLNILISEPDYGNHHHWALELHNTSTDDRTIFEIQGAHPFYEFSTYQCRRQYYSLKILKAIRIGHFVLSPGSLGSIAHAIEHQVPVRNDVPDWNCQNHVFEVLEMLEDEWWLDTDDEEYLKMKSKLKSLRGPMDAVRALVLAYPDVPTSGNADNDGFTTRFEQVKREMPADVRVGEFAGGDEAERKKVRWAVNIDR